MYHYFDREEKKISRQKWDELRTQRSYYTVREFDNGVVNVRIEWVGRITNFEYSSFPETWPLYRLHVENYDATGQRRPDPNYDDSTYPIEDMAIAVYEKFLEQWTECHRDEEGAFVEVDNDLTPPPPPDPDKPTSEIKSLPDNFTAW